MSLLPTTLLLPQQTISKSWVSLDLPRLAAIFGTNGVVVHGHSLERSHQLADILARAPKDITIRTWCHNGDEPTVDVAEQLRADLRANRPDWVAAIGGGSVLDLAKSAAGLLEAPEHPRFYQKNVQSIPAATMPFIALPTTAGTGSEATIVAVLTDPTCNAKQSIRHPSFMPRMVLLDPELLKTCPPGVIAASGLDAFIQAFESLTSRYATPFTRHLSELALIHIARTLLPFYRGDPSVAAELLEASYLAGLALSQARLGVVHGLAHPLGARFKISHGLACAYCFPACLEFNYACVKKDLQMIASRYKINIEECFQNWLEAMQIKNPLRGKTIPDRASILREILESGSTTANPRTVTITNAEALLEAVFR